MFASTGVNHQQTECVRITTLQDNPFRPPTDLQDAELRAGRLGPVGQSLLIVGALPLLAFPGFLFARVMSRRYFEALDSPLDLVALIFVDMTVLYPAVYALCVLGVLTLRRGIRRKTLIALSSVPLLYCGVAALLFFVLIASGHITT